MSTRWMAVQYVGDTLRLPIVNKSDMDKPFGSSELEREVRSIVVNPFSDSPQTFVPEAENAKLRELVRDMWRFTGTACKKYPRLFDPAAQGGQMVQLNMIDSFEQRMCELSIEVDEWTL